MSIKNIILKVVTLVFLSLMSFSCEDFVEIDPPRTELTSDLIFTSDEAAIAATNGIYALMINSASMYAFYIETMTGLYSDELVNFLDNNDWIGFADNKIIPDNNILFQHFWQNSYTIINNANSLIESMESQNELSAEVRDQLLLEAYFIRAYVYFHLVNLYGPIPYANTTDIDLNNSLARSSEDFVYDKIILDLETAISFAQEGQVSMVDRTRPSVWAVIAFLAKVRLYRESWSEAEALSNEVIESGLFILETNLNDVFLADGREAIWHIVPRNGETTQLGFNFPITFFGPGRFGDTGATALSDTLLNSFEAPDQRLANWVGFQGTNAFPKKYKNSQPFSIGATGIPEYDVKLRLAEMYLIRAEARLQSGNLSGALEDLNVIRFRAGLTDIISSDHLTLEAAIEHERHIELFAEGGNRWFDLKRTNQADHLLSVLKEDWQQTDILWPIPEIEILNNSNLLPQNDGY